MEDSAQTRAVWTLDGTNAKLTSGDFCGEVDVARPDRGILQRGLNHDQSPYALLATRRTTDARGAHDASLESDKCAWPLPVGETYVRGDDLVASYRATEDWPYSPQLYWQARTLENVPDVLGSLSLLVSVQTHLLDTRPKISVSSKNDSAEMMQISIGENGESEIELVEREQTFVPRGAAVCILSRLREVPISYVEIAQTADIHEIQFVRQPQSSFLAIWNLFAEFLEKGVIRRARIHTALLPRKNDVELALECCRAMELCALPLTT